MFNICLTDFVSTDSCSEKGCKKSPKGTNEKTHNTCTQGINLRLNDRSMKSIMHVKIQITSVIEIILVIYYVKITSLIDSDYCLLSW